eukprot:481650-Amphidinium_carterae.1
MLDQCSASIAKPGGYLVSFVLISVATAGDGARSRARSRQVPFTYGSRGMTMASKIQVPIVVTRAHYHCIRR